MLNSFKRICFLIILLIITTTANYYSQKDEKTQNQTFPKIKLTAIEKENAKGAVKVLNKLRIASEIGISFKDFSNKVIDCKVDFEEYLKEISNSIIKDSLLVAMKAYESTQYVWDEFIKIGVGRVGDSIIKMTIPPMLESSRKKTVSVDNFVTYYIKKR
jgi:hypothetical protein